MRKSTYIDYAVLMAVRSGRKKKPAGKGLMLIAKAFEENQAVQKSEQGRIVGLPVDQYVSRA
ncbi:MAG TPA: hypothetical protein VK622_01850 [Puia sp.]|nr:hypothetical protein [Puia sp.]